MKIEMSGYAYVRADVQTVKDMRDLMRFLDDNKVTGSAEFAFGDRYVYVSVVDDVKAEFIECGEHIPSDMEFDVILNTHTHPINLPETYEEALEMQLDYPAQYDWPGRDRTAHARR